MKPVVHFIRASLDEGREALLSKFARLIAAADLFAKVRGGALCAIKTHLGEEGNRGHVPPPFIAAAGEAIRARGGKPFVTETSTLYVGRRSNAVDHLMLAYEHGFTPEAIGMPVVMADGLSGHSQTAVRVRGTHHDVVHVAADTTVYDFLFGVAHVTGHMCSGMGACIKNLGMGLSSRAGKLVQHSSVKPAIRIDRCVLCGACFRHCPAEAIEEIEGKASIDPDRCVGCGECISVCKPGAVMFDWNQENHTLQEKMAEHALAVLSGAGERRAFANFAWKITEHCDCMAKDDPPVCPDLGILVSDDPVALDAATWNLLHGAQGGDVFRALQPTIDPLAQIRHAERIGLGSADHDVVEIE